MPTREIETNREARRLRVGPSKPPRWQLAARRALSAGLATVAAVIVPKCPLCIAAWLSCLGLGSALALPLASLLRPLLAVGSVAILLVALVRGRRAKRAALSAARECAKEPTAQVNSCCG